MNNKQKRRLILCRHLINFICYLFYRLRLTRHVLILFCCLHLYLPINLILRTELYNSNNIHRFVLLNFVYVFIVTTTWVYCYCRGKLVCNRLDDFTLTGITVIEVFCNFRYAYETKRDLRLDIVKRSGLAKELWYSIEPNVDTNEIYLGIWLRYYIYKFRYEFDKSILKLMILISIGYTFLLGTNFNIVDYIFILLFCLICGYSNLYVVRKLPIDYDDYTGNSFNEFERYELKRKIKLNKITHTEYMKYLAVEKHIKVEEVSVC